MQPDEVATIATKLLSPGPVGAFTLLLLFLVGLHKKYICLGRELTRLEDELVKADAALVKSETETEKWQMMLLAQLKSTDRAIAVAKTATSIVSGSGPNEHGDVAP